VPRGGGDGRKLMVRANPLELGVLFIWLRVFGSLLVLECMVSFN
jgi:hypothetical protein